MKYFISFFAVFFVISTFLLLHTETKAPYTPTLAVRELETESMIPQETETAKETDPIFHTEELAVETTEAYSFYVDPQGHFDLPIEGATGYASIPLNVRALPSTESTLQFPVPEGTSFRILEEDGNWWLVDINGQQGYVYHPYCLLNLPDVLTSIVYKNTNASQSVFTSSYLPIPNITGEQLYDALTYNERLGREEYIMPVLYGTAKKLAVTQTLARAEGNTLILYEAYRPYAVQEMIRQELIAVSEVNGEINAGISTAPWSTNWFIATGISNHQRGYAVDISYGIIQEVEEFLVAEYLCEKVTQYQEAIMPTPIHELSIASKSMAFPVNSNNDRDWRTATVSETLNESALKLREYSTEAGLTPLASEWWHFNDLDYQGVMNSQGDFFLTEVYSLPPNNIH